MFLEENPDLPLSAVVAHINERVMDPNNPTTYCGIRTLKCPLDLWVYQEIISELRPDVIIEIGMAFGGSALALAHMLDHNDNGQLIGIDVAPERVHAKTKEHPRVTVFGGDACNQRIIDLVTTATMELGDDPQRVMVIEDSAHTYANTLGVLRAYSPLLSVGDYFIVEDTICRHGLNVGPEIDTSPYDAAADFVAESDGAFVADRSRESFLLTWAPTGFLRRVR